MNLIGINNRNLAKMKTDLTTTYELSRQVHPNAMVISESGIATRQHASTLATYGINAMLIGESLLTATDIFAKTKQMATVRLRAMSNSPGASFTALVLNQKKQADQPR